MVAKWTSLKVDGYGIFMYAGEHLWRVRHEQGGPATDFSTNFLSDVQGHIEVGQTLLFATTQSANGVKVNTSPLPNEYRGTASVSGAVCDMVEEPPAPNPFVRITYICKAEESGYVDGYGIFMYAGEHLWRVRHEQGGPATDFSTNFLSDVQGHIEVGQTLLFATTQSANGVKVNTSPLPNEYRGTASVSGAVCTIVEEEPEPTPQPPPSDGPRVQTQTNTGAAISLASLLGISLVAIGLATSKKK